MIAGLKSSYIPQLPVGLGAAPTKDAFEVPWTWGIHSYALSMPLGSQFSNAGSEWATVSEISIDR